jgi:hypothetical protein
MFEIIYVNINLAYIIKLLARIIQLIAFELGIVTQWYIYPFLHLKLYLYLATLI